MMNLHNNLLVCRIVLMLILTLALVSGSDQSDCCNLECGHTAHPVPMYVTTPSQVVASGGYFLVEQQASFIFISKIKKISVSPRQKGERNGQGRSVRFNRRQIINS